MWWFLGGLGLGLMIGFILAATFTAAVTRERNDYDRDSAVSLLPKDGPPTPPWD